MKPIKIIMSLILISFIFIIPCMAADVTTLAPNTSTDWNLWILSGIFGLLLFLLSLNVPSTVMDVEIDAITSVMAWVPIAFCAYASFSIVRYVGVGVQTLYSIPTIGIIMSIFLLVAIGNTIRIIALHKSFTGES